MTSTATVESRLTRDYQRPAAAVLLLVGVVYLIPFVERGWVPLDEGMIGQAAERVLNGALPHVDYEEPYPGALSYLYAAVFGATGIDSAHLRWTVFGAAVLSLAVFYTLARRYLEPLMAAGSTSAALVWAYPNYFSSLPSWWLLLCALVCLWGVIRYSETERLIFVIVAGLAAGIAATFKQTGFYLLPPLVMCLLTSSAGGAVASLRRRRFELFIRLVLALAATAFVVVMMRSNLGSGELVYLVVPIAASCATFVLSSGASRQDRTGMNWKAPLVAVGSATVPLAILLIPQFARGDVSAFVNGVFLLPQKRLEFTLLPMPPPTQLLAAGAAFLWLLWSPRTLSSAELRIVSILRWGVALALPLLALRLPFVYTFIWEAVRGTSAMLPLVALWMLTSRTIEQTDQRRALFAASAMLAWTSLGQFPFAAPIYFCYVAPLALIAGLAAFTPSAGHYRLSARPALATVILFAVLSLNRGYVWNVGSFHQVQDLSTPLNLARAELSVASYEADVFRRVVSLVQEHLGHRGLVAGPDTPDIYFLTGQFNTSGRLFDFFSTDAGSAGDALDRWTAADVIVIFHGKRFSPPLQDSFVARLRDEFPQGETVAPFEVRWR